MKAKAMTTTELEQMEGGTDGRRWQEWRETPMTEEEKDKTVKTWRIKENIGYFLAALWLSGCVYYLLAFTVVFPSSIGAIREFFLTASLDLIRANIIGPITRMILLIVVIRLSLATNAFDGVLSAFPALFDFSYLQHRTAAHVQEDVQLFEERDVGITAPEDPGDGDAFDGLGDVAIPEANQVANMFRR